MLYNYLYVIWSLNQFRLEGWVALENKIENFLLTPKQMY